MNARNRGIFLPHTIRWILRRGRRVSGQAGADVLLGKGSIGYSLKEQRLDRPDSAVGMEAPLHHAAVQQVIERQQRHALVVCHVSVNHHAPLAAPTGFPCEIDGFVKSHRTVQAEGLQPCDVGDCHARVYLQAQQSGVRGDHFPFVHSRVHGQCRDPECAILIGLMRVESAMGRTPKRPREDSFPAPNWSVELPHSGTRHRAANWRTCA